MKPSNASNTGPRSSDTFLLSDFDILVLKPEELGGDHRPLKNERVWLGHYDDGKLKVKQVGVWLDNLDNTKQPHQCNKLWVSPGSIGRLFSIFMSHDQRDALVGDLEERYETSAKAKGREAATLWFWREVVHSFIALALDGLKKCSGLGKLIEKCRRIGS